MVKIILECAPEVKAYLQAYAKGNSWTLSHVLRSILEDWIETTKRTAPKRRRF